MSEPDRRWPTDPSTIVVFSDLNCSFAHLAVHRLHRTRAQLGLAGRVWFDHRAFPLELFNRTVNERPGVDSEVTAVGALDPSAGWQLRRGPDWTYPVTMLPPLEAVQAAKSQSLRTGEDLDLGLRRAFWVDGACISLRHVILDVAAGTGTIDVDRLTEAIDTGAFRAAVMDQFRAAQGGRVTCSPHLFLHDGSNMANPGVRVRWQNGGFGIGFPVIDADDPDVYVDLLTRTAAATARSRRNDTSPHQLAER